MKRKSRLKKIKFDPEVNVEQLQDNVKIKTKASKKKLISNTNKVDVSTSEADHFKRRLEEINENNGADQEEDVAESRKDESKRSKKRKKHIELVEETKIKNNVTHQERSLNYLSKWKHSPHDWKFEKNRQAWLKQNMFDVDKVPEQFWDILVEYFSNAKGNIRKTMVDDALKIIEAHENKFNEAEKSTDDVIVTRARSIIQSVQE